jgi:NAD(P)-dependent dehydrogenase (short-subunit alcohol dehydrogenase family)
MDARPVVVVTGASAGVGRATARLLHLAEVVHMAMRRAAGDTLRASRPELDSWDRDRIPELTGDPHGPGN